MISQRSQELHPDVFESKACIFVEEWVFLMASHWRWQSVILAFRGLWIWKYIFLSMLLGALGCPHVLICPQVLLLALIYRNPNLDFQKRYTRHRHYLRESLDYPPIMLSGELKIMWWIRLTFWQTQGKILKMISSQWTQWHRGILTNNNAPNGTSILNVASLFCKHALSSLYQSDFSHHCLGVSKLWTTIVWFTACNKSSCLSEIEGS